MREVSQSQQRGWARWEGVHANLPPPRMVQVQQTWQGRHPAHGKGGGKDGGLDDIYLAHQQCSDQGGGHQTGNRVRGEDVKGPNPSDHSLHLALLANLITWQGPPSQCKQRGWP